MLADFEGLDACDVMGDAAHLLHAPIYNTGSDEAVLLHIYSGTACCSPYVFLLTM